MEAANGRWVGEILVIIEFKRVSGYGVFNAATGCAAA